MKEEGDISDVQRRSVWSQFGVSANHLHGCEQFNLQHTSHREGVRRRSSADYLCGLEEKGGRDREAQGLGGLEVEHQLE